MTIAAADVLDFWFMGDAAIRRKQWFEKNIAFDAACGRFGAAIRLARDGAFDDWAASAEGGLALIVLLDQLSRNVFRGLPEAFAADPKALAIARSLVARQCDLSLQPFQRMFVYLPFEHAEAMADQTESVRLFETIREALGEDTIAYAHRHRDVIARFGRFPHRNFILGRVSTAAELDYLAEPGAGF